MVNTHWARNNASAEFLVYAGGSWQVVDTDPLGMMNTDQWYHITGIYDGSNLSIYLNGVLAKTASPEAGNIYSVSRFLEIGRRPSCNNVPAYFNGTIDEVRIYNRALSPEEIKQHYEEIDMLPPVVTNPSANQSDIPDDTDGEPQWGETAQLNVTVTDDSDVAGVTLNLSEIGGAVAKPMTNIGGNIYSTTTNASAGTLPKIYNLTVNATDSFGNSNTNVKIPLRVRLNGDTTGDGKRNIGDALRLANNVSYPGDSRYLLK